MRVRLTSNQSDQEKDALRAIAKLVLNENKLDSSALLMLCQYLQWNVTTTIMEAMWVIIRILKEVPDKFSTELDAATQRCLQKLLIETDYDNTATSFSFDEKLEVRKVAAILSSELWKYYEQSEATVPDILLAWRDASTSQNEFAEIRNAWK